MVSSEKQKEKWYQGVNLVYETKRKTSWDSKAHHLPSHSSASFQHGTQVHQSVINREQLFTLGLRLKWFLYNSRLCVGSYSTTWNDFLQSSPLKQGSIMHLLQDELSQSPSTVGLWKEEIRPPFANSSKIKGKNTLIQGITLFKTQLEIPWTIFIKILLIRLYVTFKDIPYKKINSLETAHHTKYPFPTLFTEMQRLNPSAQILAR